MKLSVQPTIVQDINPAIRAVLTWLWQEISRAHNASVQPRFVEDLGNPPTTPPEMEQYELIFYSCPNWSVTGHFYLVYFDGVDRHYFERTDVNLV